MKINIYHILLCILLFIVIIQQCNKPKPEIIDNIVRDTTIITIDSVIYKPGKDIPVTIIDTQYFPVYIDTASVVKDYYVKKVYSDSISIVKNGYNYGYIGIIDTVSENQILSRKYEQVLNIPVITNTITKTTPPINQVFVGLNSQFSNLPELNTLGGGFILKTKKDKLYQLKGGVNRNLNWFVEGGLYTKISLRKKR